MGIWLGVLGRFQFGSLVRFHLGIGRFIWSLAVGFSIWAAGSFSLVRLGLVFHWFAGSFSLGIWSFSLDHWVVFNLDFGAALMGLVSSTWLLFSNVGCVATAFV